MKKYTVSEVRPRIFLLKFKRDYDLCMMFLRYKEFYELPNSRFRGKQFELLDFMEWYSNKYGNGIFTYPNDWAGFNFFGNIIKQVWDLGISDRNAYDYEMKELYQRFLQQYPDGKFYIIGAHVNAIQTIKHEIAHGFFYINSEYKKEMTNLVKKLKPNFRNSMNSSLKGVGYTPKVYIDECQAYLSTGMSKFFTVKLKLEHKPFIEVFDHYYNIKNTKA